MSGVGILRPFYNMTVISMLSGESPPRRSYQRTLKQFVSFTSARVPDEKKLMRTDTVTEPAGYRKDEAAGKPILLYGVRVSKRGKTRESDTQRGRYRGGTT